MNAFNLIINQLASIDVKIEDGDKCILLIFFLLESLENLIIAITSGGAKPKMDTIILILILEDMRRKTMHSGSQDALHVRGSSKEKGPKGDKKKDKSKGLSKTPEKSRVKCWNCGK